MAEPLKSPTLKAPPGTHSRKSSTNAVPKAANSADAAATPTSAEEKKLSGAELKKLKQAEKQAKRAQKKAEAGLPTAPPAAAQAGPSSKPQANAQQQPQQKGPKQPQLAKVSSGQSAPAKQQQQQNQMPIPIRTKGAGQGGAVKPVANKKVVLFGHLYGQARRYGLEGVAKEVHPAVLALGLQMSNYEICGSTARCVAMLLAFKSVISAYTTPHGTSLARHLTSHHLSPQIDYLKSCRPLSVSMGNAIRFLKDAIIKIDPAVPESEAKAALLDSIDQFIRERVTAADAVIASTAAQRIADGDVIATYAKSSLVLKTLLAARALGRSFSVVVVDTKPLFEGRRLAADLVAAGVPVSYGLVSGAPHLLKGATKVFLGAHALMGNGQLYSRVGTAIVAMHAHSLDIPVIVLSESLKFTDRVALDSIVLNEVAAAEELFVPASGEGRSLRPAESWAERDVQVAEWTAAPGLQCLNILFDATPAEFIKLIITEHGSLPPSSVPAVLRMLEVATGQV